MSRPSALVLAALAALGGLRCTSDITPSRPEADPAAALAISAVEAAVDAATVVDVSVGGLVNWEYEGEDVRQATIEAFLAIFAALDEPPWNTCLSYEQTSFDSTFTTFEACPPTATTPEVSGTVHIAIEATLGGEHGVEIHIDLDAENIEIDGSRLSLHVRFEWDPAAGVMDVQTLVATVDLPSGAEITIARAGDLGLDADPACQTLEGEVETTLDAAGTLTVEGYEQCLGSCPSPGGSITYEGESGPVRIEFDGSDTALQDGRFEIPLDCSP